MTQHITDWDKDVEVDPEAEYQALLRTIRWTKGFGLSFVRCSPGEAERLIEQVKEDVGRKLKSDAPSTLKKQIEVLRLKRPIDNLYEMVAALPNKNHIDVLFITGIEKSLIGDIQPGYQGEGEYYNLNTLPRILGHLNLQRERFRDDFDICFIFLVPLFALKYFTRRAPDFFDWRSGVWEFGTDPQLLEQESSRILLESDFQEYLALSSSERTAKIVEIQELIDDIHTKPDQQVSLLIELGILFIAETDYQSAIASYDKTLELKPDDYKAWNIRGIALKNLGRYEEAIASYDKSLEIKPDYDRVWHNRGIALKNLGRYEEAVASYDKALQLKPDGDEDWYNRGIALGNLGRYEEAIASYDKALQFKPNDDQAWNNRGVALGNLGRYEEAIASYDKALQFKLDKDQAWYNRGVVLGNLGRFKEAIASYDKSLEIKPDKHEAFYNKACCYALQAKPEAAVENLKIVISLAPEKYQEMAKTDSDFDSIRDNEAFQALFTP